MIAMVLGILILVGLVVGWLTFMARMVGIWETLVIVVICCLLTGVVILGVFLVGYGGAQMGWWEW